jgi:hypothetical protein
MIPSYGFMYDNCFYAPVVFGDSDHFSGHVHIFETSKFSRPWVAGCFVKRGRMVCEDIRESPDVTQGRGGGSPAAERLYLLTMMPAGPDSKLAQAARLELAFVLLVGRILMRLAAWEGALN